MSTLWSPLALVRSTKSHPHGTNSHSTLLGLPTPSSAHKPEGGIHSWAQGQSRLQTIHAHVRGGGVVMINCLTDHGGASSKCCTSAGIEVINGNCSHEWQLHVRVGVNPTCNARSMWSITDTRDLSSSCTNTTYTGVGCSSSSTSCRAVLAQQGQKWWITLHGP